jgi:hypothetical protein
VSLDIEKFLGLFKLEKHFAQMLEISLFNKLIEMEILKNHLVVKTKLFMI